MRRVRALLGIAVALGAVAMASARPFPTPKMLPPTSDEFREYVQSHGHAVRFYVPKPSGRPGYEENVRFVSLANDKCVRKDRRLFLCRFDATGQLETGRQVTQALEIFVTRDDAGALNEVIIVQGD